VLRIILQWPQYGEYYAQYYSAVFNFVLGSGREDVLSGNYVAHVAVDLALCLIKGNNRHWMIKDWYRRILQYTH
jgi:hypothetical protein